MLCHSKIDHQRSDAEGTWARCVYDFYTLLESAFVILELRAGYVGTDYAE